MSHYFKKQFGQNFLRNKKYALKMAEYLDIQPEDTVIEIGPGEGMLTNILVQTGTKVMSIEIDYTLIPNLIKRFTDNKNFYLVHQDFLVADLNEELDKIEAGESIKVVGSLPYNISKRIIDRIVKYNLEQKAANHPRLVKRMSFIIQDEVAKEYVALAPRASFLSNYIKIFADVKKMESVPAIQFFPMPKVNGGIIVIEFKEETPTDYVEILKLIRIGFLTPRKTLLRNLKNSRKWGEKKLLVAFNELELTDKARAAELAHDVWEKLYLKLV